MKKAMPFLLTAVLTLSLTACTPEAKTDRSTTQTTVTTVVQTATASNIHIATTTSPADLSSRGMKQPSFWRTPSPRWG